MRFEMKEACHGWDMFDNQDGYYMNTDECTEKMNELALEMEQLKTKLGKLIHYPNCWDTACYPNLENALIEIGCSECHNKEINK